MPKRRQRASAPDWDAYAAQAQQELRAMACSPELSTEWERRLRLYHEAGTPAAQAVTTLLEEHGYFEDD